MNNEIAVWRIYLLRAGYLIVGLGLALMIFPGVVSPTEGLAHANGVVRSLLAGVGLLALLGIRYPIQMLPILLFELLWKTIWILAFGLRYWSSGRWDAETAQSMNETIFGVVLVLVVVPWDLVAKRYVLRSGDPWRKAAV